MRMVLYLHEFVPLFVSFVSACATLHYELLQGLMSTQNVKESMWEYLIDNNAWQVIDYERSDTGSKPAAAPVGNYLVMI